MVEGVAKGVKFTMFLANAIIFIGGLVVFAVGVWTLSDKSFMERLLGTNLYVASAAILIATGIIVAIVSFLGTFGAYKEIKCMILTYFIFLFMIFVVMIVGGILGYIFRSEVDDRMHTEMYTTVKLYGNDTAVTEAWDAVQRNFKCCGIVISREKNAQEKSFQIWDVNPKFNQPNGPRIPESCCRNHRDDNTRRLCQGHKVILGQIYTDGCYEKMKEFVKGHALLVAGIAIGISSLLIFGMILSCALFLMIK